MIKDYSRHSVLLSNIDTQLKTPESQSPGSEKPIASAGQSVLGGSVENQHYKAYMVMHVMSGEKQEAGWEMI